MTPSTENAVGRAYAKALLELANDQNQIDTLADEAEQLGQLVRDDADLRALLETPAISSDRRRGVIENIFKGRVSETLYRLMQVMNTKGRADQIGSMTTAFARLIAEHRGIIEVDAYVASPMDEQTAARVRDELGRALGGKQVHLNEHVDESLIGGLKVRIGDRLIDGSVSSKLRRMRAKLIEAGRERARA